jgi:biotin transport system permease protein
MIIGLYRPGDSLAHRAPSFRLAGALAIVSTALFFVAHPLALASSAIGGLALFPAAGIPPRVAFDQVRPALWIIGAILAFQVLVSEAWLGIEMALRFTALILFAAWVSLTTKVSAMIAVIEAMFGVPVERVSLAIGLAIRFLPIIADVVREADEARRARGRDRSLRALAVPSLIRTLKAADRMAEAIDARSFEADEAPAPQGQINQT